MGGLNTQKTPHLHPEWTTDTHILITGPEEGLKIQEGGSSNVVSIICPLSALVEIGLTDLSKSGFHGILESDRPFLLLRRYRTRAIITRGLYTFYPIFEGQKRFFKELFFVKL